MIRGELAVAGLLPLTIDTLAPPVLLDYGHAVYGVLREQFDKAQTLQAVSNAMRSAMRCVRENETLAADTRFHILLPQNMPLEYRKPHLSDLTPQEIAELTEFSQLQAQVVRARLRVREARRAAMASGDNSAVMVAEAALRDLVALTDTRFHYGLNEACQPYAAVIAYNRKKAQQDSALS